MMRFFRSAFVIARRDFSATVLSKAFIFFLLAPLFPLLMGGVFGGIGARVASRAEQPVIAVIGPRAEFDRLQAARKQVGQAVPEGNLLKLVHFDPQRDTAAQERKLLASGRATALSACRLTRTSTAKSSSARAPMTAQRSCRAAPSS